MKLNFGSAHDNLGEDWKNVDALDWEGNTDILHDMTKFPYPFENESIDEIRSVENLEHISWRLTDSVLKEWNRILKLNGKLHIQVPDAGKCMEYYVKRQICECVPHKADRGGFFADPDCVRCSGLAKINPQRWLLTFLGAQKHPYDAHLSIFTENMLKKKLAVAGFKNISFKFDLYKLKVNCEKV